MSGLGISVARFGYDPFEDTLKQFHTDTTSHSGRTLLEHLRGTRRILRDWGMPDHVQIAGLFHSIYGTNIFQVKSAAFEDRDLLEGLIGKEAERLAYLFCVTNRPDAFLAGLRNGSFTHAYMRNRHSQELVEVRFHELLDLLVIEAANHIEQNMGHALVGRIHEALKDHHFLSQRAKDEMLDYSTSSRKQ